MSLSGKTIVITRAKHQAKEFAQKLQNKGANILFAPCIDIVPIPEALSNIQVEQYDWIVFTSQNSVKLFERDIPKNTHIGAVGSQTAVLIKQKFGIDVSCMPTHFDSLSLAQAMGDCRNLRILLPQGNMARPQLAQMLESQGAIVTTAIIYQTIQLDSLAWCDISKIHQPIITFFSPSAVISAAKHLPKHCLIACIGTVTKQAAINAGLNVDITPQIQTGDGLVAAIEVFLKLCQKTEHD